ncbi:NAD(P)/FAD-dependent oxidoreductase [Marilutibacter chinensis]|uniref:FAD-binding oxidoreductase n=1 Tax=Marilutibacter chinensis TaxID=2912247 RepID=A0ABS9HNC8_9GAMM|nr:FAD-binding oxidoreductase [Lysobacter chinensis]MCF7220509.1 FAD-binding oxidoreductase [Lysobacter chinensis]
MHEGDQPNYYRETAPAGSRPELRSPLDARVCVIGGGFAGLNTALGLAERGVDGVVVLEAREIGFGASGRNGGFVFGGYSRGEAELLRDLGRERARELYAGTVDAVALIRRRISDHAIACDIVEGGVIWANWFRDPEVLRTRQRLLADAYGVHWQWLDRTQMRERLLTDRYHDGLFEPGAFHLHPLKYAQGLARVACERGVQLFERTPATGLARSGRGWTVATPGGRVAADTVVLACGGYLAGLVGRVDAGVLPIATYVMVTEPLGERLATAIRTPAAVYDTRFAFDYYRALPDTRLLWGGRISIHDRSPRAVERLLYRDMTRVFPQLGGIGVAHAWSGLMSYARHQMPQMGRIDDGLWLAQAFGGHGVAPTTHAGEVVASAIAEGDERWMAFSHYGLVSAMKPAGFIGAQLGYWWAEARDAWKDWTEGLAKR